MNSIFQGRNGFLVVLFLAGALVVGCDSVAPGDSTDGLTPPQNGFTAKVKGIPGEAERQLNGGLKTKAARNEEYMGQAFDGAYILLDATKEDNQHEYISFFHSTFEPLEVKSYEIGGWSWTEDSSATQEWPEFFADYVQTVDNEERLYPASSGQITITVLTDDSIEGTFSFESTMFYGYTIPDFNGDDPSGFEDYHFEAREVTLDEPLTVEGSFKAEVITFEDFCVVIATDDGSEPTSDDDCYEEMPFDTAQFGAEYFIYSDAYGEYADSMGTETMDYAAPALNGANLEASVYPYCAGGSFEVRSEVVNNEARIRLYHENDAEFPDCNSTEEIQQLSLPVPDEALAQTKIVLLNPDPYLEAYEDGFVLR